MRDQLTVRGFGQELANAVQRLATREKISLNQAALKLLRQGAGLRDPIDQPNAPQRAIEELHGAWTPEESAAIDRAISDFSAIEAGMWE